MPKGGASSLTPVYAGLQEDLDTFLKAFLQLRTRRFADYKQLFCHRGMAQLFNGRSNSAEIIEFNEYLLVYCLPYMEEFVCPGTPRSIEERLFGLYSLYTFFYLQEVNHVVKIRVDPDALRNFGKLERLVLEEKDFDAYMICLKLHEDRAFKLVAFISIYDPSCFKRFYTDNSVTGVSVQTNVNDPLSSVRALAEGKLFTEISVAHNEYQRMKKAVGFRGSEYADPQVTVMQILEKRQQEMEVKIGVDLLINTDHSLEKLGSHGMVRKEIKEKAHSADLKLARFRRHRTTTPLQVSTEHFKFAESSENVNSKEEFEESGPVTRNMAKNGQTSRRKPIRSKRRRGRMAKKVESEDVPEDSEAKPVAKKATIQETFAASSGKLSPPPDLCCLGDSDGEESSEVVMKSPPLMSQKPMDMDTDPKLVAMGGIECEFTDEVRSSPEPSSNCSPPKSIIKKEKKKKNPRRRVSFAENRTGQVSTRIHEIPARPITNHSDDDFSNADDESMELETSSIHDDMRRIPKDDELPFDESPEKESNLESEEHCEKKNAKKELKTDDLEPAEPASDLMDDDETIFLPLENEAELWAEEREGAYDISSESENELFIDE